ncbi:MAG: prolyl oligopeptidase family serine peptidase [Ilumatobacteraceae bacterium]
MSSVIPVERCIAGRDLTEPRLSPDGTVVVYASSAGGRPALMWQPLDGSPVRQLTAHPPPRAGRGLGGGCWCWTPDGDAVVYAAADGNLWLQPVPAGAVRRLTDADAERPAFAPSVTADGASVVYVVDEAEVWMASLDGSPAPQRLDDGTADFCFDPAPSPDGSTVAWVAWNVPDMPWDRSRIVLWGSSDGRLVEDAPPGTVQQPRWLADGRLASVRDDGGWLRAGVGGVPFVAEPFEHAGPSWGQGQRSFAVAPDGRRVAFARNEAGFGRLCVVDLATGAVDEVARGVHGQLSWAGERLAAIRTGARTPTQIVLHDTVTWTCDVVAVGPLSGWEDLPLAEPSPVEVVARDGATIHARRYAGAGRGLLCWVHGGPTDQWQVTFLPRLAYWRAQGWDVLVPDHRGSTGHGRAYQQAMQQRWGELDVADVVDTIRHAHAEGWASPVTTIVLGASAGGFTALGVAGEAPLLVAGVAASYPVTDLVDLAERSHRFERHSTIGLVGTLPEHLDRYLERSPVLHPARLRDVPVLLLHGDSDPVVPVEQSQRLAAALAEAGGDVELHVYPGEGHGFRQPEHQLDEYRRLGEFFERVARARSAHG